MVKGWSSPVDVVGMTQGTVSRTGTNGWMTVREVAEAAGVDVVDVRAAAVRRELPAVSSHPRGGGDWMFKVVDVERWLAAR